jgi:type I restriction enzyme, S subunit
LAEGTGHAALAGAESVDEPWELPTGWRWCSIGRVTKRRANRVIPSAAPELTFVGLENIAPGTMHVVDTVSFASMKSSASAFQSGDVLYSRLRPYLNKVYVADSDGACSGEFFVLEPTNEVTPQYLAYYLHSQHVVFFASHAVTGDRPRLDFTQLADFLIPVPPIDIQTSIVARIEELFAEIGEGETAIAEANVALDTCRKSLLNAAVTGKLTEEWRAASATNAMKISDADDVDEATALTEVPGSWSWCKVANVIDETTYGTSIKCGRDSHGVPVLRMGNIREDGSLALDDLKYAPFGSADIPMLEPGDVLFNRTNSAELLGKTAVYAAELSSCSFASYLVRIRLKPDVNPYFFAAWLNSSYGKAWVAENKSQQVGQANLSAGKLRLMPLPIAPLPEQKAAVELLRTGQAAIALQYEISVELEGQSKSLRQSILASAFRGELVA